MQNLRLDPLNCILLAGDYWPGEVETQLNHLVEEERKAGKKSSKKHVSGGASRPGKKAKRCNPYDNMDEYLMGKLGEVVHGMKDDFIVVHLQEACSYCRSHMCETSEGWVIIFVLLLGYLRDIVDIQAKTN